MADVLIIDDDIESRQSIINVIEESEYSYLSVYESATAQRGLILLKQNWLFAILCGKLEILRDYKVVICISLANISNLKLPVKEST